MALRNPEGNLGQMQADAGTFNSPLSINKHLDPLKHLLI